MKFVVALGGNALGNSPAEQKEKVRHTAKTIADLISEGHQVVICHGNGPQVGMIKLAMDIAASNDKTISEMPFPECGAMSQGYIGYHLQNAIREELKSRNMSKPVTTLITQCVVDKEDPAFNSPSKPIGAFYSKEEAEKIQKEKGYTFKEDAGRGYRRVVPSPKPIDVTEKDSVMLLLNNDYVVITAGGGGIPVYSDGNALVGVAAVIDKDFASELVAEIVDADFLIILTAVEKVAINFGKPDEKQISQMTLQEAEKYIEEKQFAPGSMLPKVQAAMKFAASKPGRKALITSLEKAAEGIEGKTGTIVIK